MRRVPSFIRLVWSLSLVMPLLSVACSDAPFRVTDSFTEKPEGAFAEVPDRLHDYVVGTRLELEVRAEGLFINLDRIDVVSKDPDVLKVEGQTLVDGVLRVSCLATGEGTAALTFLDEDKRPLEERVVEVKRPDEVVLTVNIDTDRGFTIPKIEGDTLLIAQGGQVTFQVGYQRNGRDLKGIGVLTGHSDVVAVVNPTRTSPDREFVTLQAPDDPTAAAAVVLEVSGQPVRTLEVRTAALDEIAAIELDVGEPGFQGNGSRYPVWAKAFDDDAEPIFGAPYRWNFDGERLEGDGDLLFYEYAGGERRRVQVKAGPEVEDITVEAKRSSAEVATTAAPGCASGAPASTGLLLSLLAWRRRARRDSAGARDGAAVRS